MIDMAKEEVVYRSVPVAGILVPSYRVPPVSIETAIGETCHFREYVEDAFPDQVPCEELLDQ